MCERGSITRRSVPLVSSGFFDFIWLVPYAALSRMFMEPAAPLSELKTTVEERSDQLVNCEGETTIANLLH